MKPCYFFFHQWGRWEDYEQAIEKRIPTTVHDYGVGKPFEYFEDLKFRSYVQFRQKRHCERCGLMQDREVKG